VGISRLCSLCAETVMAIRVKDKAAATIRLGDLVLD